MLQYVKLRSNDEATAFKWANELEHANKSTMLAENQIKEQLVEISNLEANINKAASASSSFHNIAQKHEKKY